MLLPFDAIVTTNYDWNARWFLSASPRGISAELSEIYNTASLQKSFEDPKDLRLIYMHGKAWEKESRLVVDRFDYAELMSEHDGLFDFVTNLLRDACTLYVGFSLNDPSFNLLEDRLHPP